MLIKADKLIAWSQLIRIPNLLTVPGDPLAGFFLAAASGCPVPYIHAVYAALAGIFLYAFGLVSNDLFDLPEDRRERPSRPLACGKIRPFYAMLAAMFLAVAGIGVAGLNGLFSLEIAGILAAVIIIYNFKGKHIPWVGPINMGLCRGLSLLLGAAAADTGGLFPRSVIVAACGMAFFIAAITALAANETREMRIGMKRWLPVFILMACFALLYRGMDIRFHGSAHAAFPACLALIALSWNWHAGVMLAGTPSPGTVSKVIGRFIQGLLVIQAVFLSLCDWPAQVVAAGLVAASPLFSVLARRFYSS